MPFTVERKIRYGFIIAFIVVLLAGAATLYTTARFAQTNRRVRHSQDVIEHLGRILTLVVDEESGGRGFALTGRPEFREPFLTARRLLPDEVRAVRDLTADDRVQQGNLNRLEPLLAARREFSEQLIETRRTGGLDAAAALITRGRGEAVMDRLRHLLGKMSREEADGLVARTVADDSAARWVFALQLAFLFAALALASVAVVLLRRMITAPAARLVDAVERLATGDLAIRTDDRPADEFGRLGRAFNELAQARARVEEGLSQSKALLDGLFRASPLAVVAIDTAGVVDVWNPAAERLFGFQSGEMLGHPLAELLEAGIDFADLQSRAHDLREAMPIESKLRRKDGSLFDARFFVATRAEDGHLHGMMALAQDITEERRVERRLAHELKSLTRLQQIASRFVREGDLLSLTDEAVDAAVAIMHADSGTLRLRDPVTQRLTIAAHRGLTERSLELFAGITDGPTAFGSALEAGQRVIVEDLGASPLFVDDPAIESCVREGGIKALVSTPLFDGSGKLAGVLSTHYRAQTWPEDRDLALLDLLISQVSEMMERSAAEKSLLRSEEGLKLAQKIAHLGSWELDLVTNRLTWSDEVYRIFGLEPQEFGATYEAFLNAVHPDDRAALDMAYQTTVRENQNAFEFEHRVVQHSTGAIRIVHERCENFRDASGRIVRSVGTVHDITERKRIEQRLQESEERLRLTIDEAPIGIALVDLQGRFVQVNKALCAIVDYPAEALIGKRFQDITLPDYLPGDTEALERLVRGEISKRSVEKRYFRRDGTVVDVMLHTAVMRNRDGLPRYFVSQIEDITERKHAEAALKASEERFRRTLDDMLEGGTIFAPDWTHLYMNQVAARQSQHRVEDLLGRTLIEAYPGIESTDVFARYQRCMKARTGERFEASFTLPDGRPVWFLLSVEPVPEGIFVLSLDITASKEAEHALRTSETRFRELVEQASDGIFIADLQGHYTDVNSAACQMLGYSREELIGKTIRDLMPPEDVPRIAAQRTHLLTPGATDVSEWTLRRKDGSEIPVEVSAKILPDGRWQAIVRDISDRKRIEKERMQAEEAVRRSEAKYSGIIALSTDAIISVNGDDQRITLFNKGAEHIFGYSEREVVGKPLDALFPPRLQAVHRAHVAKFAAGEVTARRMGERMAAIFGRRKTGEEFPAEASISKLEVGGEKLLTVVLRDITARERLQMEQRVLAEAGAILTSSLDYQQTLTGIAELIVRELADVCALWVSGEAGGAARLTVVHRFPRHDGPEGGLVSLSVTPGDPPPTAWATATQEPVLWRDGPSELFEGFTRLAEPVHVLREREFPSGVSVPLVAHGGSQGLLLFATSGPRRYDADHLAWAGQLAGRIALAVENSRLYRSAQRATQARDDLLGIVAHDLRNPLSSIKLATQVLEHQLPANGGTKGLRSVETILRSTRRADRLIQDLLDVTRLEAGRLSVERHPLAVEPLVYDAVDAQQSLASAASVELQLDIEPDLPEISADSDRFVQVMENLIGNALKFTPPGGRIRVHASRQGQEVLFSVADTGTGIPPEHLPHVFDRFWQAKRTDRKGAGLGLPICKGIVEATGGRIWVESEPGRGSTFHFTMPVSVRDDAQPSPH